MSRLWSGTILANRIAKSTLILSFVKVSWVWTRFYTRKIKPTKNVWFTKAPTWSAWACCKCTGWAWAWTKGTSFIDRVHIVSLLTGINFIWEAGSSFKVDYWITFRTSQTKAGIGWTCFTWAWTWCLAAFAFNRWSASRTCWNALPI